MGAGLRTFDLCVEDDSSGSRVDDPFDIAGEEEVDLASLDPGTDIGGHMGVLISDVVAPRDVVHGASLALPKADLSRQGVPRTKKVDDLRVDWLNGHRLIMQRDGLSQVVHIA